MENPHRRNDLMLIDLIKYWAAPTESSSTSASLDRAWSAHSFADYCCYYYYLLFIHCVQRNGWYTAISEMLGI